MALVCGFAVALAALMSGCTSDTGKSQGEMMAQSFERTQVGLMDGQLKVDNTLMTMDQFQYTGNIITQYNNYKAAVADLEQTGEAARRRAESMRVNGDEYIKRWDKDMAEITDPSVKGTMEGRQDAVKANYSAICASADDVKAAYDTFLQDHKAIQQALSVNLSQATVASLKRTFDRTHADGAALKAKMATMQKRMESIETGAPMAG